MSMREVHVPGEDKSLVAAKLSRSTDSGEWSPRIGTLSVDEVRNTPLPAPPASPAQCQVCKERPCAAACASTRLTR